MIGLKIVRHSQVQSGMMQRRYKAFSCTCPVALFTSAVKPSSWGGTSKDAQVTLSIHSSKALS
jgi:hypothetical protein